MANYVCMYVLLKKINLAAWCSPKKKKKKKKWYKIVMSRFTVQILKGFEKKKEKRSSNCKIKYLRFSNTTHFRSLLSTWKWKKDNNTVWPHRATAKKI